jgi:rhamnosyltransferase
VFTPDAAVIHSHEFSLGDWLRREFDEARAIYDVYRYAPPLDPRVALMRFRGFVGADWRWASAHGERSLSLLLRSTIHQLARTVGWALGGHAHRLPRAMVRRLSLEGRS